MSNYKVLFILTGSIACFKACEVISSLIKKGNEVQVVVTDSALNFVGRATLEGLTGKKVLHNLWEEGQAMDHIQLARWADLILVAPASAHFLNKLSAGIADDLASTLFLAHDFKKPFVLAPAMNTQMYVHPITQKSISNLKNLGLCILPTGTGDLACREFGAGRLLEPEQIIGELEKILAADKNSRGHVLVTAGGTQEPIDEVRYITNKSTGKTAAQIADEFILKNYQVTYLHGRGSQLPTKSCASVEFTSFSDLEQKLFKLLQNNKFSAVIHAAAVSDFSVINPQEKSKISSDKDMTLTLKVNPKLINRIKKYCPTVVAFKLTAHATEPLANQAISKLFSESNVDLVIHNDSTQTHWLNNQHKFNWVLPNSSIADSESINDTKTLSVKLTQLVDERLSHDTRS